METRNRRQVVAVVVVVVVLHFKRSILITFTIILVDCDIYDKLINHRNLIPNLITIWVNLQWTKFDWIKWSSILKVIWQMSEITFSLILCFFHLSIFKITKTNLSNSPGRYLFFNTISFSPLTPTHSNWLHPKT